jgi:hypothetical protein
MAALGAPLAPAAAVVCRHRQGMAEVDALAATAAKAVPQPALAVVAVTVAVARLVASVRRAAMPQARPVRREAWAATPARAAMAAMAVQAPE